MPIEQSGRSFWSKFPTTSMYVISVLIFVLLSVPTSVFLYIRNNEVEDSVHTLQSEMRQMRLDASLEHAALAERDKSTRDRDAEIIRKLDASQDSNVRILEKMNDIYSGMIVPDAPSTRKSRR